MFDAFKQAKLQNAYQTMRNYQLPPEKETTIEELKRLSGNGRGNGEVEPVDPALNTKKHQYIRDNNIRPGAPEWFKVMFAKPHLTGEDPFSKK